MRLTLLMLILPLLALTACSTDIKPKPEPIRYKTHKLNPCGAFKYERKNDNVILDYRIAECLKSNLIICCKDKKSLEVANKANIEIIETLNRDDILAGF